MKERRRWKTDWRRCKKECKRCKKEWSRSRGRKCGEGAGECVWKEV